MAVGWPEYLGSNSSDHQELMRCYPFLVGWGGYLSLFMALKTRCKMKIKIARKSLFLETPLKKVFLNTKLILFTPGLIKYACVLPMLHCNTYIDTLAYLISVTLENPCPSAQLYGHPKCSATEHLICSAFWFLHRM